MIQFCKPSDNKDASASSCLNVAITGTLVPENFRSRERKFRPSELSFSRSKLSWNFRSLTLIIRPALTMTHFFNYSYDVGVDGTILSSVSRPSVRLSVRNGCRLLWITISNLGLNKRCKKMCVFQQKISHILLFQIR